MKRTGYLTLTFGILVMAAVCMLAGCKKSETGTSITSFDQLREPGRKIGAGIGTGDDLKVREAFPDAEVLLFNDGYTGYNAVAIGQIDAFVYSKKQMNLAIQNGQEGVKLLDETIGQPNNVAVGLSPVTPIKNLQGRINAFIEEKQSDGTLDDMYERWIVDENETMPDIPVPEQSSVHLRVATSGTEVPFTYYVGTRLNGYDIELARRFASWLNAELEFKVYDYNGIIAAAQSGDVDCIMAELFVTPERSEAIPFSETLFTLELGVMVRDEDSQNAGSLWQNVQEEFEKTFIREDRWKLFVRGIGTTLLITVLSVVLGTALGFGVFMAGRKGNRVANAVTGFFIWFIKGMPVVVLLMILYYLIFRNTAISGTMVSVIAFMLVFGAGVYNMIKAGVGAVDIGQTEAAYTLGFTDRRAFFRVVLPQAMPHFLPAYKESITELIKATAVVGYVAVQDLTKMGDIVRSRTYEAFFPLIAVAVMYFILAAILMYAVNRIEAHLFPERRNPEKNHRGGEIK